MTTIPVAAAARPNGHGRMRRYDAQTAIQPNADASEPTSAMGTRMDSPANIHSAVESPMPTNGDRRGAVDRMHIAQP